MISPNLNKSPDAARSYAPTLAASLLVGAMALLVFYGITLGFRALTFEHTLRISLAEQPRHLPDIPITDVSATGASPKRTLVETIRADGRVTLLAFFYTRCTTLCSALGSEFQQLQDQLEPADLGRRVRLLSVTFDPHFDTTERLQRYGEWQHARPGLWMFARPEDSADLRSLLRTCGVLLMPDGAGGYRHTANIYLVGSNGDLLGVYGLGEGRRALDAAIAESRKVLR